MDRIKLKKLGFKNLDTIENMIYDNKKLTEYNYYSRHIRPDYCITLSKIKISEATKENYAFLGLCIDSYGNKGFLFNDKRKNIPEKIKNF